MRENKDRYFIWVKGGVKACHCYIRVFQGPRERLIRARKGMKKAIAIFDLIKILLIAMGAFAGAFTTLFKFSLIIKHQATGHVAYHLRTSDSISNLSNLMICIKGLAGISLINSLVSVMNYLCNAIGRKAHPHIRELLIAYREDWAEYRKIDPGYGNRLNGIFIIIYIIALFGVLSGLLLPVEIIHTYR